MTIFDASSISWLFKGLFIGGTFLLFSNALICYVRKNNKSLSRVGYPFVLVGLFSLIQNIYYYSVDFMELARGDYLVVDGVVKIIKIDRVSTKFEVSGIQFNGSNYVSWASPDREVVNKLSGEVRVFYVVGAEHGVHPGGNKVLKIELL